MNPDVLEQSYFLGLNHIQSLKYNTYRFFITSPNPHVFFSINAHHFPDEPPSIDLIAEKNIQNTEIMPHLCHATKLFIRLLRILANQINRALYTKQEKVSFYCLANIGDINQPFERFPYY